MAFGPRCGWRRWVTCSLCLENVNLTPGFISAGCEETGRAFVEAETAAGLPVLPRERRAGK